MRLKFHTRAGKEHLTCAVFGGKNSKEKVGFPVRADSASLSLMCILKISDIERILQKLGVISWGETIEKSNLRCDNGQLLKEVKIVKSSYKSNARRPELQSCIDNQCRYDRTATHPDKSFPVFTTSTVTMSGHNVYPSL